MSFESVKAKNPGVKMYLVTDPAFQKYGRVIKGYDFSSYVAYLKDHTAVPETGNQYVASIPEMEEKPITKEVEHYLYAGMPVQVGYCNGNGSLLNAFEYHKCSEVSVGPTDMVFMMYKVEDLSAEGTVDSKDVVAFYCPAGVAVEIYPHTLHYAPCKVEDGGFKCLVILQKGTNAPIEKPVNPVNHEDRLIMARNKWAFGHKDSSVVATRGGFEGILGENTCIQY